MTGFDGLAFARLFRSSCTVCGSGQLSWGSVGDLLETGHQTDDWLSEVAAGLGIDDGPGLLALAAWRCDSCGEVGVFGPIEVGP